MAGLILKILLILIGTVSVAGAVPTITTLTGTPGDGNSLTITGTGYENHPNAAGGQKPGWYTNFEDQNVAPMASLSVGTTFYSGTGACMSATSVDKAEGTYSVRHTLAVECEDFTEAFIRVTDGEGFGFDLGGHMIVGVHRKNTSPDPTANWKHIRGWSSNGNIYPDFYIGNAPADGSQIYTEICPLDDGSGAHTQDYFGYVKPNSTWRFEIFVASKAATGTGTTGAWYSRQDAVLSSNTAWGFSCTNVNGSNSSDDSDAYNMMGVEDDISNDTTSGFAYYDDIYIDTMVATYVYFTDASTLVSSTKFWIQPYTAMSTTEITIYQQTGDLGTNYDNIYVYACQYESCSAGKQLSTAGAGGGGGSSDRALNRIFRGKTQISGKVRT